MTLVVCLVAGLPLGAEVLDSLVVDGKEYQSVKWGPVNQGKVVIFHNRGVATIPLEKLPPEYQARFGYKPPAAQSLRAPAPTSPPPDSIRILESMQVKDSEASQTTDWTAYSKDRVTKVILNGELVEKSRLKELTGYIVRGRTELGEAGFTVRGSILELAQRREDVPQATKAMELRPSLWKGTGEQVLLSDYPVTVELGALIRVYVAEGRTVTGVRTFHVGTEPTFEQWQNLR